MIKTKFKALRLNACLPAIAMALCLWLGFSVASAAETQQSTGTATGQVYDSLGDPLPGATVMVDGMQQGAVTDIDGNFSIPNVAIGATLRVTYVGCNPAEVKWEGHHLTIVLEDDSKALDEVVVVGFGTQKKVNLTGAVSTVSAKELANRPINSVADAMQGLVPGLDVLSSSLGGQLNGTRTMNIRGTGSIGTGSSVVPLVLIDGMEGDINTVNPQDVENISILKDASASSIYGSRAAGGVILITTKKGKEGKVTVNYSDNFRFSHAIRMPDMMDSYSFAVYMHDGAINAGTTFLNDAKIAQIKAYQENPVGPSMFANADTGEWEVWGQGDLAPIANTDWMDVHFGKTPFSQEHNISITGGTEKFNYYFSGNLLSQEGLLRYGDDKVNRYIVNGKISTQLASWLRFSYSTRWFRNNYDAPSMIAERSANQLYHDLLRYWPILPTTDPNGYYLSWSYIPGLTEGGRYNKVSDRMDQQFNFIITPLKGLTINAEFNYRNVSINSKQAYLNTYAYKVDGTPFIQNAAAMGEVSSTSFVQNTNTKSNYFNPNVFATYDWTINEKNNFKVMAGFQSEWYRESYFSAKRTEVINNIEYLNTTSGTPTVSGYAQSWSTAGFFGRVNYDYDGRYLVEGNIRYDGTSRFRTGTRWCTSPSFSLGWNIAREAFWESLTPKINTFKLRFSWGKLGNQNTTSLYPTYQTIGYYANNYSWLVQGSKPSYATQPSLVSSTLTWEKNRTWDIGFDLGMLNNRLTATVDYYNRKTMDMVGPGPNLPDVLGTSVPKVNSLDMTTKGWELTISWRDRIQDFFYGVSFNLYDHNTYINKYPNNPNKLLSVGDSYYGPYYEGARLGDIWGYETVGIAKTDQEMQDHLAKVNQNALGTGWHAGDIMYADLDGDGRISTGDNTLANPGDRKIIGNNTPRYQFGLTLDAQWKGFDVKVFFQGVMKRDYWASGTVFWGATAANIWQADPQMVHLDYFRDDPDHVFGLNLDSYYPNVCFSGGRNTQTQTRYLQNAAYCRLKNVTVGYTLPHSLTQKFYVENLRIFFSGENLATMTSFTKTGDPELIDAYRSAYGYGKVYPLSRVLSFGLNVTF